jgi:hypothetical protein
MLGLDDVGSQLRMFFTALSFGLSLVGQHALMMLQLNASTLRGRNL